MRIFRIFIMYALRRNKFNYILGILSISLSIVITSLLFLVVENFSNIINQETNLTYILFKFRCIQTIICFLCGIVIFHIYFRLMKSSCKEFGLLKMLGANTFQIRFLIVSQIMFLLLITVPIGLYLGIEMIDQIFLLTKDIVFTSLVYSISITKFYFVLLFVVGGIVLSAGVLIERGMKEKLPWQLLNQGI